MADTEDDAVAWVSDTSCVFGANGTKVFSLDSVAVVVNDKAWCLR